MEILKGYSKKHRNVCPLAKSISDSEIAEVNNGVSNSMIVRYYMIEF